MARISLAIETRSTSARQALEENTRLANAVVEALKGFGLTEDEIKTDSYHPGEKLIGLYHIQEEVTDYVPYLVRADVAMEEMGMGTPTPIMPDEVVVRAMVTSQFSF